MGASSGAPTPRTLFREPPVIETARLRLREFEAPDFDAHAAIMRAVFARGHLGPAMDREDKWRRIVSSVGMWRVVGFGGLIVERREDRRVIGNVGLFVAPRAMEPDFGGEPEMGWILDPEEHGKGYAEEACRALLDWADAEVRQTIWAIIDPANTPSHRLAGRLGFTKLQTSSYRDAPIDVYRRPAPRRRRCR
ncbi:GNAT family N-acetyltransferase [Sphingomonas sp. ASV193]|uniref:GNAT family N-acetyltransferase n=1 Tax=Sphingomonas sp. ASV193 TaxID=3144405 RepID=UPI0032E87329